jgi:hypothetical protein
MKRATQTAYRYRLEPSGLAWTIEPTPAFAVQQRRVSLPPMRARVGVLSRLRRQVAAWGQAILIGARRADVPAQEAA